MMDIIDYNELTGAVIGAAIAIHRQLGPGLREVAYEEALSIRLLRLGVANRRQVSLPLIYKNALLDCGYRLDILVDERLPLELKAISQLQGIHDGECLSTEALVPVVVANEVPVFSTCVESLTALHTATALARLRQGGWNRGLILNFHSETMLKGIKRVVL